MSLVKTALMAEALAQIHKIVHSQPQTHATKESDVMGDQTPTTPAPVTPDPAPAEPAPTSQPTDQTAQGAAPTQSATASTSMQASSESTATTVPELLALVQSAVQLAQYLNANPQVLSFMSALMGVKTDTASTDSPPSVDQGSTPVT